MTRVMASSGRTMAAVMFSFMRATSQTLTNYWETTDSADFTTTFASATLGADVPFYVSIPTIANGSGAGGATGST